MITTERPKERFWNRDYTGRSGIIFAVILGAIVQVVDILIGESFLFSMLGLLLLVASVIKARGHPFRDPSKTAPVAFAVTLVVAQLIYELLNFVLFRSLII